jgi:hypothetical protein
MCTDHGRIICHPAIKNDSGAILRLARVFVRFDHVASVIVNANHSIMRTAVKLGKADGVADCVWPGIPQWTVCQRIGN